MFNLDISKRRYNLSRIDRWFRRNFTPWCKIHDCEMVHIGHPLGPFGCPICVYEQNEKVFEEFLAKFKLKH